MIIGIAGKKGVGKDLVGKIIQYLIEENEVKKEYKDRIPNIKLDYTIEDFITGKAPKYFLNKSSYDWRIVKFADKLKDIVCLLIGCTREQLEDPVLKETELGKEWWYFKGRNGSLIPYSKDSKRSNEDLIKPNPRMLLQQIGTNLFRNQLHPQVWVNATMANYKSKYEEEDGFTHFRGHESEVLMKEDPIWEAGNFPNWIITDVRFKNEANAVKERGGITIRINRNTKSCPYENLEEEHISETALDNYQEFDYIIDNNSTIEELIEKVKEILIKEKLI